MSDLATLDEPASDAPGTLTAADDTVVDEPPRLDPAKAYDSPEALAEYDTETADLVSREEVVVSGFETLHELAKANAKHAKDRYEDAQTNLRLLIRDRKAQRGKPPQPRQATIPYDASNQDVPDGSGVVASLVEVAPEDDAWKALSINELVPLGLPQSVADKLSGENGIDTLGKWHDFIQPSESGWMKTHKDLKGGIGPKKWDAISDAFAAFWPEWNKRKADATRPGTGGDGGESGAGNAGQPGGVDLKTWTDEAQRVAGQQLPD